MRIDRLDTCSKPPQHDPGLGEAHTVLVLAHTGLRASPVRLSWPPDDPPRRTSPR